MPLISSNTDLKSLSFGKDRPGGGNSGQPFVYFGFPNLNIPTVPLPSDSVVNLSVDNFVWKPISPIPQTAPQGFQRVGNRLLSFLNPAGNTIVEGAENVFAGAANITNTVSNAVINGSIRGLNGVIGGINAASDFVTDTFDPTFNSNYPDFLWRKNRFNLAHSFVDVQRITQFFFTPSGLFFLLKQNLLERQNVKVNGLTRLYSPLNTIAQVGVTAYGYHLNKAGLNPFEQSYFKGGREGYYFNTKIYNVNDIGRGDNRLTTLMLNKINRTFTPLDRYGVTAVTNRDTLIRYNGGPGAPLGIGFTRISLTDPTREVTLLKSKTIFSFYNKDINDYDYLTPINKPSVAWYYNPLSTAGTVGSRSVFQQYAFKNSQIKIDDLRKNWFGTDNASEANNIVLNRNTNIISSSLYAPSGSPATISKLGLDPTKPEYYTPNGNSVNWSYVANRGVSGNYAKAIQSLGISNAATGSIITTINSTPPKGEQTDITSNTNIFKDKNNLSNNEVTLNGTQISNKESLGKTKNTSTLQDFRNGLPQNSTPSTPYKDFNREKTYQASKTTYKGNWSVSTNERVLDPNVPISGDQETPKRFSDIIDFNFTLEYPNQKTRLIDFTAYLEDWGDSFKADYNSIKYMGRAESFYKYNGFSREGSVSFLVPTLSRRDLISNYKKLNALAWSVSPSYSDIGLMRGVITNFTMGDYFRKMPILIKGVDYSQINDMGWEINRDADGDVWARTDNYYTGQLPKGIKVSLQFTIIHNYVPKVGVEFIGYDPEKPNLNIYIPEFEGGQTKIDSGNYVPYLVSSNNGTATAKNIQQQSTLTSGTDTTTDNVTNPPSSVVSEIGPDEEFVRQIGSSDFYNPL